MSLATFLTMLSLVLELLADAVQDKQTNTDQSQCIMRPANDNFGKCKSILINFSLLYSEINAEYM